MPQCHYCPEGNSSVVPVIKLCCPDGDDICAHCVNSVLTTATLCPSCERPLGRRIGGLKRQVLELLGQGNQINGHHNQSVRNMSHRGKNLGHQRPPQGYALQRNYPQGYHPQGYNPQNMMAFNNNYYQNEYCRNDFYGAYGHNNWGHTPQNAYLQNQGPCGGDWSGHDPSMVNSSMANPSMDMYPNPSMYPHSNPNICPQPNFDRLMRYANRTIYPQVQYQEQQNQVPERYCQGSLMYSKSKQIKTTDCIQSSSPDMVASRFNRSSSVNSLIRKK